MTDNDSHRPHSSARRVLDFLDQAGGIRIHDLRPIEARRLFESLAPALDLPEPVLGRVENREVAGGAGPRPALVQWPDPAAGEGEPPLILFFHGGGFVLGSAALYARLTGHLAIASGAVVVSVDYRLAPESPFPAAAEDAIAAAGWAVAHAGALGADARKVFIAGDSAGGNLAAVAALARRDAEGLPLAGQILVYPATDMAEEHASRRRFGEGLFLERDTMRYFVDHYAPEPEQRRDWRCSPLHAETLVGLPPAYMLTAELDPLVDEAEAYADRLDSAGVPVTRRRWPGMIHGFLSMGALIPEVRTAIEEIGAWIGAHP